MSVCPGLRELRVTGLSWSCLSALVSPTLPCLRLLDLRWCDGIRDAQIKELVCPPGESLLRDRKTGLSGVEWRGVGGGERLIHERITILLLYDSGSIHQLGKSIFTLKHCRKRVRPAVSSTWVTQDDNVKRWSISTPSPT